MTFRELQDAAASLTFCGGLSLWKPRLAVFQDNLDVDVRVRLLMPERDNPDKWSVGSEATRMPVERLEVIPSAPAFLRERVRKLVLHEIDEALLFAGVRMFDPHTEGK